MLFNSFLSSLKESKGKDFEGRFFFILANRQSHGSSCRHRRRLRRRRRHRRRRLSMKYSIYQPTKPIWRKSAGWR